ncbi:MAG: sulfurtransferase-like selenium metabolism protein YedF [Peptostreptococcales bacterium]|jgi:selenium metabolism protein YedF
MDKHILKDDTVIERRGLMDNTVVVLSSDKMGEGDEKLGRTLLKNFIYALTEQEYLPKTILLYNSGAYLATKGSDSLEDLKLLESQGVQILTCGTCLNYYQLTHSLEVGTVTNMYTIAEKQMNAIKIINP